MRPQVEVAEAHRVGGDWFAELHVRARPEAAVTIEQIEGAASLVVRTDDRGRAAIRVRLPVPTTIPYALVRLREGPDAQVAAIGAEHVPLADLLRTGDPPPVGAVVTATGGSHTIRRDLALHRAHLFLGPGTRLDFAHGAGVVCTGGTIRAVGTAIAPIVLTGIGGGSGWRNLTVIDGLLPSRLAHCRVAGGAGRPAPEGYERLTGRGDVGGGVAALHASLELADVTFEGCAAALGGAVYAHDAELRWERVRFVANRARRGGAAALQGVVGALRQLELERNAATEEGPDLWCSASPDLRVDERLRTALMAPLGGWT